MGKSKLVFLFIEILVVFCYTSCKQSESNDHLEINSPTSKESLTITLEPSTPTIDLTARVSTQEAVDAVLSARMTQNAGEQETLDALTSAPRPTYTPPPLTRPEYDNVSGLYGFGDPDSGNGWCVLQIILGQESYPQELGFDLYCNRGAPTYNEGYTLGHIIIERKVAVYSPDYLEPDETCFIVFQFQNNRIKLTQIGGSFDCGFGHAVYADGTYELIDDTPPEIGCYISDLCSRNTNN